MGLQKRVSLKTIVRVTRRALPLALVAVFPAIACAHPAGHAGGGGGLFSGFTHPLGGLDHLCAMIAVGLWAAQCGGRSLWIVPLVFVGMMTLGGALGIRGVPLPLVEPGIVASVLVMGLLLATALRLPLAAGALIVAVFALLHGHSHGDEMPATVAGVAYVIGFVAATMCLQLVGIGAALSAQRWGSTALIRLTGGAITACGIYLTIV